MKIFKGIDGDGQFGFERIEFSDSNGSITLCCRIEVTSLGFSAILTDIWFYKEDLESFIANVSHTILGNVPLAYISAMSDFNLVVTPADSVGYFQAKFSLKDLNGENSAVLTVKIEHNPHLKLTLT